MSNRSSGTEELVPVQDDKQEHDQASINFNEFNTINHPHILPGDELFDEELSVNVIEGVESMEDLLERYPDLNENELGAIREILPIYLSDEVMDLSAFDEEEYPIGVVNLRLIGALASLRLFALMRRNSLPRRYVPQFAQVNQMFAHIQDIFDDMANDEYAGFVSSDDMKTIWQKVRYDLASRRKLEL